ncbi:unnamed protein product [Chironomus riparius]|uniref:Uncharacterized protein n=1 Tax=Chironomus riparius TaxID=315576 RepID=A0A9N9WTW5_9DIPT|nr:unnamed protein product [Chironomus riparius]
MSSNKFCHFFLLLSLIKIAQSGTPKYVYPPTSPTRHQLISGIGVPLNLQHESITYGWTMKAQYFLPETINQLHFQFFPDVWVANYTKDFLFDTVWQRFPNGRKRREVLYDPLTQQHYEKYEGIFKEISNMPLHDIETSEDDEFDDQFEEDIIDKKIMMLTNKYVSNDDPSTKEELGPDLSTSRWSMYDAFSTTLEKNGFNGRMCLLRAICEATWVKFSRNNLMGELFHIFFTPSTTSEPTNRPSDYDYIKAEAIGRDKKGDDETCKNVFYQCKQSILDIFTQNFDELLHFFN